MLPSLVNPIAFKLTISLGFVNLSVRQLLPRL